MAPSSKTRKLLWSRAHNACAICKKPLTSEADSGALPGLILGEEAHIVAQREDGPRGRGDRSNIDGYSNLILLCADDHKRVDEQPDVFTVEILKATKTAHEAWTAAKFAEDKRDEPIRQVKAPGEDDIPLDPIVTGAQLWNLIRDAGIYYMRTVEGEVDADTARAADDFLTTARDWGDISADVEVQGFAAIREAQESIQAMLLDLWERGLFVYGRRVMRTIKGGSMAPAPWPTIHLWVMSAAEIKAFEAAGHFAAPGPASPAERSGMGHPDNPATG